MVWGPRDRYVRNQSGEVVHVGLRDADQGGVGVGPVARIHRDLEGKNSKERQKSFVEIRIKKEKKAIKGADQMHWSYNSPRTHSQAHTVDLIEESDDQAVEVAQV